MVVMMIFAPPGTEGGETWHHFVRLWIQSSHKQLAEAFSVS